MRDVLAAVVVGVVVGGGCMAREADDGAESGTACGGGMQMTMDVQVPSTKVDVLMVVDNSRSMSEEQAEMARALPEMVQGLLAPHGDGLPGPLVDLHIGVTSTDVGTGGARIETCHDPVDGDDGELMVRPCGEEGVELPTYLSYPGGVMDWSVDGVAEGAGCLATLGTNGCGVEQQLEAPYRTLREGANPGFLRDDSILVVLWLTDEEDCSMQDSSLFDSTRTDLGHFCLRCFLHQDMLWPVQRYVDRFRELRPEPGTLLLGFVVGVPPGPECEGAGDQIGGCLEHERMQETVDPADPTRLRTVCSTETTYAFPGVRLVQVAQAMGADALVGSVCAESYSPFLQRMSDTILERVESGMVEEPLPFLDPVGDGCLCQTSCTLVERMEAGVECPDHMACWEPEGPGTGCGVEVDRTGAAHALCEVDQVEARLEDCTRSCEDPWAAREPYRTGGWIYTPGKGGVGWIDGVRWRPLSAESELTLKCCY